MNYGDEMAFPDPHHYGNLKAPDQGLSKREYFAAMAMQAMAAKHEFRSDQSMAEEAVSLADALLTALNREPVNPEQ